MNEAYKYIVLDIETVPDTDMIYELNNEVDGLKFKSSKGSPIDIINEYRKWLVDNNKNTFFKPVYHKLIGIGIILLNNKYEPVFKYSGASMENSNKFIEYIESLLTPNSLTNGESPTIVGFGTSFFDIKCLVYNALRYRINIKSMMNTKNKWENYLINGTNNTHIDLASHFGMRESIKLKEICYLFGLDAKPTDLDGSKLEELIYNNTTISLENKMASISKYVLSDVDITTKLFYNYLVLKGLITNDYRVILEDKLDTIVNI